MNRYLKLPARFLLVLLGTILITAAMTSVSAGEHPHGLGAETTSTWLKFQARQRISPSTTNVMIRDDNCTVAVTADLVSSEFAGATGADLWAAALAGCGTSAGSGDNRYSNFESCWINDRTGVTNGRVTWPTINPDDDFEITPYCKRGDDVCAEELRVCFNAHDCDENDYESRSWDRVGELWDEAGSCLHDGDEDDEDVWECIDEALDDWFDDHMGRNDDYDDLEDERESRRGFVLLDYEDDLDDVGDAQPRGRASETVLERYQRQWAARTPTSIYQSMNEVDTRGPSFRLTADEFLTVNFTAYLESTSPYQICNTTIGCVTVTTYSNTFRSYMQNLHVIIQDRSVLALHGPGRLGRGRRSRHSLRQPRPDLLR